MARELIDASTPINCRGVHNRYGVSKRVFDTEEETLISLQAMSVNVDDPKDTRYLNVYQHLLNGAGKYFMGNRYPRRS